MGSSNKIIAGGITKICRTSFTRQNDVTTYAVGDVIADATPTTLTFVRSGEFSAGSGMIQSAALIDSANQALKLDADLFLFDTAPTGYGNDNATFTPSDAHLQTCVGVINFAATAWRDGNLTVGAVGNTVCWVRNLAIPFKCTLLEASLFGVLVARNAYIPIALSPFYLALGALQD